MENSRNIRDKEILYQRSLRGEPDGLLKEKKVREGIFETYSPMMPESKSFPDEQRMIAKRKKKTEKELYVGQLVPVEKENVANGVKRCTEKSSQDNDTTQKNRMPADIIAEILLATYSFANMDRHLYYYMEDEGYWKVIQPTSDNRELRLLINSELRSSVNKSVLYEVYEWLLVMADKPSDDNRRLYYLNFKDCAVNWKTGERVNDRKNLMFTYRIEAEYGNLQNHKNDSFRSFMDDVFHGDKKTKREFYKFLGLCLSDIRYLKILVFLYGPSNSGKSVVLNLLKALVGAEWTSNVSFSQLSTEFAISRMLGKRLNISGEVSGATNKRLDIVKSLTGNDEVEICFKGKDYFPFSNTCMLVFACNVFPSIQTILEFDSFLKRLYIFPFKNEKDRSDWNINLLSDLIGDKGSVIEKAIEGLKMLEADGFEIIETDAMKSAKDEFISCYNSFALFAEKYIEKDFDGKVPSSNINREYHRYCQREALEEININIWSQLLKQAYGCKQTTMTIPNGAEKARVRGYLGIKLKNIPVFTDDDMANSNE